MAILQMLGKIPDRVSDLAEMVFNRIMLQAGEATKIDFVGDQYLEISIKNMERGKRGSSGQLTINMPTAMEKSLCPLVAIKRVC